jgi:hypothetical protein
MNTFTLPLESYQIFDQIFISSSDQDEERRLCGKLGHEQKGGFRDSIDAAEFLNQCKERGIPSKEVDPLWGAFREKEGHKTILLETDVEHPNLIVRLFHELAFNRNFPLLIKVQAAPRGASVHWSVTRSLGRTSDSVGCIATIIISFLTLGIGGIIFYFLFRQGKARNRAVVEAAAEAIKLSIQRRMPTVQI